MGSQNILVKLYCAENIGPVRWWHRVRDGTMSREKFVAVVEALRVGFKAEARSRSSFTHCQKRKIAIGKNSTHSPEVIEDLSSI